MAEEVLGISGQMDISDIEKSFKELIGQMQRLSLETDKMSQKFTQALENIKSSSADSATKQKQAMEVFASSIDNAKRQISTMPLQLREARNEVNNFKSSCDSLTVKMMGMKIGSKEFEEYNQQLQANRRSMELAVMKAQELSDAFDSTKNFVINASAAIDTFNGVSVIASGSTMANAMTHGAAATAIGTEVATRVSNTDAINKETQAIEQNTNEFSSNIENISQKKQATNEYSSALDSLIEKLRQGQQITEQQANAEIQLARERIAALQSEKNVIDEKYAKAKDYADEMSSNLAVSTGKVDAGTLNDMTQKTQAAYDAMNTLGSQWNELDKTITQISSSINTLNDELSKNAKNSDNLSQSVKNATSDVEKLNQESEKATNNDPWQVQGRSVEYLKEELKDAEMKASKLKDTLEKSQGKANDAKESGKTKLAGKYTDEVNRANDKLIEQEKRIKAITDELKKQGVEIDKNTEKTKKQDNSIQGIINKLKGGFGGGIGGVFSTLMSGKFLGWVTAIGALLKGFYDITKAAEEYRKSLATLKHYMDSMDFKSIRQDIVALTATTSKSASDMAGAATYFAKVWEGLRTSPEALITMVKAANEYAILSGKTSSESAKAMANLAFEYHMSAQEAIQMSSIIATATRNSISSFEEMAQAISSAGTQAAVYGVSFRDMATLIGYSSNQFGGAQKAASKFSMMLMTMNGLQDKFRPSAVGMVKALENMKEAYDRGERPQDNFIKRNRAVAEYFIKNADAIKKYGSAIDSNKTKEEMLADRAATAEANLKKLKNAWDGVLTSLNVNITPIITSILQGFNKLIGGAQRTTKELRALDRYNRLSKNDKPYTNYIPAGARMGELMYDKSRFLSDYNNQEKILSTAYRNAVTKYQKLWKDANSKNIANAASNEVLKIWEKKRGKYYTIDETEINQLLGDYRAETIALSEKTINSGTPGDGGDDGKKEINEANKKAKQREELIKMQRQREIESEKQALAALQSQREEYTASITNDSERELAEMRDAHRKRIEQIQQQEKDYLEQNISKAAQEYQKKHENDKSYKGFYSQGLDKQVTLTNEQRQQLNSQMNIEIENYKRMIKKKQEADDEYRLQYLEKYGYDYEKRLAIAQQYDKKIANASNEWQKKSLEEEKKSALSAFDLKQATTMFDWEAMLGDVKNYTKKSLQIVKEQIDAYMQTDQYKALQPSEKQIIINIRQEVDDNLQKNPFKRYSEAISALKAAKFNLYSAEIGHNAVENNPNATPAIKELMKKRYSEALAKVDSAEKNATESGVKLVDKINLLVNAFGRLGSSADISIGEIGSTVSESLKALDVISEKTSGIIQVVATSIDILSKYEITDIIGNVLESTAKGVGNTVNSIGKVFGLDLGLGVADYSGWQEADNRYKELSSIWDSIISKKQEYLSMSWGVEAQNITDEMVKLVELEKEQIRLVAEARLGSGSSWGSSSIWYRMWQGSYTSKASDNKGGFDKIIKPDQQIRWFDVNESVEKGLKDAGLGDARFQSMYDMINMTGEQLQWIKENYTGLWAAMDSEFRGYLEQIIEYGEKSKDIIEELKNQVLGTTIDDVIDSALSSLREYADGAEDVFDEVNQNWQKMINKMLVNSAVGNKLKENLNAWYEDWYTAYDTDKTLDSKEIADLKSKYDEIVNNAKSEIDALRQAGLIKDIDTYNQSATAKSISNITYDQADALEGRITAIQICCEQQLVELQNHGMYQKRIADTADMMMMPLENIDANISSIISIQTSMNEHLENIANNTQCLPQMAKDITKIKKNTDNL